MQWWSFYKKISIAHRVEGGITSISAHIVINIESESK
jgi:hypothetical protein